MDIPSTTMYEPVKHKLARLPILQWAVKGIGKGAIAII